MNAVSDAFTSNQVSLVTAGWYAKPRYIPWAGELQSVACIVTDSTVTINQCDRFTIACNQHLAVLQAANAVFLRVFVVTALTANAVTGVTSGLHLRSSSRQLILY